MKASITHHKKTVTVDLSQAIDISIPLSAVKNPLAWYIDPLTIAPVQQDDWVGSVAQGGVVNFNTITFNPHAHGTHTETVGHITKEVYSVNKALSQFFFMAELITVTPEVRGEELVISRKQLMYALKEKQPEALVIRTMPNTQDKKTRQWSHKGWPFMSETAMHHLRELGVKHLLIDLPSVDPEKDEGKLLSHRAFWNVPEEPRLDATITEMIYVPHQVQDGSYILNLQIASFENDATPSKPVLYRIE